MFSNCDPKVAWSNMMRSYSEEWRPIKTIMHLLTIYQIPNVDFSLLHFRSFFSLVINEKEKSHILLSC